MRIALQIWKYLLYLPFGQPTSRPLGHHHWRNMRGCTTPDTLSWCITLVHPSCSHPRCTPPCKLWCTPPPTPRCTPTPPSPPPQTTLVQNFGTHQLSLVFTADTTAAPGAHFWYTGAYLWYAPTVPGVNLWYSPNYLWCTCAPPFILNISHFEHRIKELARHVGENHSIDWHQESYFHYHHLPQLHPWLNFYPWCQFLVLACIKTALALAPDTEESS